MACGVQNVNMTWIETQIVSSQKPQNTFAPNININNQNLLPFKFEILTKDYGKEGEGRSQMCIQFKNIGF